jgi:hypothetical protein
MCPLGNQSARSHSSRAILPLLFFLVHRFPPSFSHSWAFSFDWTLKEANVIEGQELGRAAEVRGETTDSGKVRLDGARGEIATLHVLAKALTKRSH